MTNIKTDKPRYKMKILKVLTQRNRDFVAIYRCPKCGRTREDQGYNHPEYGSTPDCYWCSEGVTPVEEKIAMGCFCFVATLFVSVIILFSIFGQF